MAVVALYPEAPPKPCSEQRSADEIILMRCILERFSTAEILRFGLDLATMRAVTAASWLRSSVHAGAGRR